MPSRCALYCMRNGTTLHRFPNPDKFPEKFKAWVAIAGGILQTPHDAVHYRHKRICDIHFKKEDWNRNKRLKASAVPSLHLPMGSKYVCETGTQLNDDDDVLELNEPTHQTVNLLEKTLDKTHATMHIDEDNIDKTELAVPAVDTAAPPKVSDSSNHNCPQTAAADAAPVVLILEQSRVKAHATMHNFKNNFLKPGLQVQAPTVDIPGPFTLDVDFNVLATNAAKEHNYCTNPHPTPSNNRKSKSMPSNVLTVIKKQRIQIKNLKREILRLRKRCAEYKERLGKVKKMSEEEAFEIATRNMDPPAKMFIQMQMSEYSRVPKGR